MGNLKGFLSDDYSGIWNTSYWAKSFPGNNRDITEMAGFSGAECSSGKARAGLRPVAIIPTDNIVKTNEHGNITK